MKRRLLQIQPQFSNGDDWVGLAEAHQLQFECIELSMPLYWGTDERSVKAKDWYRNTGRVAAIHGCFIDVNPGSGDEKFRDLSMQRCRESCELAQSLNAKWVIFHSSAFPFLRGPYLEAWTATSAKFYKQLAEEYDLTICIENSFDIDPTPMRMLMERIDDPRVRVCLDIGHANYSHAPLNQWFEELGPYIGYLHISDNRGEFDDHLPMGEGTVDWKMADALYRQLGRNIPMTLEVGAANGVRASLQYMEENDLFKEMIGDE